ncbi:MAG: SDR family NAD(P)-dependent oxidoreductase, partial [Candidatus Limnocylindria bacterium]
MSGNGTGAFAGQVAFITGASGGIGRATAIAFAAEAAKVVASDISEEGIQETVRLIEEQGGRALAVPCDVTRSEDVEAAIAATVSEFGRLDVAFNNAGVEQPPAAVADTSEAEWDRIININLRGAFVC